MVKDPPARARDACSNPLDQEDTLEKEIEPTPFLPGKLLPLGCKEIKPVNPKSYQA